MHIDMQKSVLSCSSLPLLQVTFATCQTAIVNDNVTGANVNNEHGFGGGTACLFLRIGCVCACEVIPLQVFLICWLIGNLLDWLRQRIKTAISSQRGSVPVGERIRDPHWTTKNERKIPHTAARSRTSQDDYPELYQCTHLPRPKGSNVITEVLVWE